MRYFIYCRKSSEAEDRQVLSIESQLTTLQRTFADRPEIEIVDVCEEAFSAKSPGRPRFNEMVSRIERGEAAGIMAWAPDRLARNSIDGGRLVYLLDCGVLRDLKFATYTFENNSQGKFMLQIMFGQSKYYSDALSENVKRGNRTKIELGWLPNQAPLGYLNDAVTKTIVKDPIHFPLIAQIYQIMLTGAYSPRRIALMARDDWGFRTPKKKRIGGKPLSTSTVYRILTNPFYAGMIRWGGEIYRGRHDPIVSIEEFQQVQRLLHRPGRPKPQKYTFAYSGMIRCGACGLIITAEHKVNRYGAHYVYYHCSRSRLGLRCKEPSVELRCLEEQIHSFLRSLMLEPTIQDWILKGLSLDRQRVKMEADAQKRSLEKALNDVDGELRELTGLRVRNLLTDAEFLARRTELREEQFRLQGRVTSEAASNPFEPFAEMISFSNRATQWFSHGDDQSKRVLLEIVSSNLTLHGKILNIEAKKPFRAIRELALHPSRLGVIHDVRTLRPRDERWLARLQAEVIDGLDDPTCRSILANIRMLRERFEPEARMKHPASAQAA